MHPCKYDNLGNEIIEEKCPYCRTPVPCSIEEYNGRLQKRVELDDAEAISLNVTIVLEKKMVFHKIMQRHSNYLFEQESLVTLTLIAILVILMKMAMAWK